MRASRRLEQIERIANQRSVRASQSASNDSGAHGRNALARSRRTVEDGDSRFIETKTKRILARFTNEHE